MSNINTAPEARSLVPCRTCLRHVRADEAACPFCGAEDIPAATANAVVPSGLARAVVLLGIGFAASGCNSTNTKGADTEPATRDSGAWHPVNIVPPYGQPPPRDPIVPEVSPIADGGADASSSATRTPPFPVDRGSIAPMYGLPPHRKQPPKQ